MNRESKHLPIYVVLAAGLFLNSFSSTAAEPSAQKTREELLKLHNEERSKEDLKPLKLSSELTKAAQTYAEYLAESGEFSHTAKGTPKSRSKDAGYEGKAGGENIAKGQPTPPEVFESWMESETHKGNILSDEFTEIGFGIARDKDGDLIWVVDFGSR